MGISDLGSSRTASQVSSRSGRRLLSAQRHDAVLAVERQERGGAGAVAGLGRRLPGDTADVVDRCVRVGEPRGFAALAHRAGPDRSVEVAVVV